METIGKNGTGEEPINRKNMRRQQDIITHRVVEQLFEVYQDKTIHNANSILGICSHILISSILTLCEGDEEKSLEILDRVFAESKKFLTGEREAIIRKYEIEPKE